MSKFYKPQNLDLNHHISRFPPPEMSRKFKIEHVAYIIDRIVRIPANNKHIVSENGYVPLSSKILQRHIFGYKDYLSYLETTGIIETNRQYFPGECCRGYRFTQMYQTPVASYLLKSSRNDKKPPTKVRGYTHLTKWFNKRLQIDYKLATDFIKVDLARKLKDPEFRERYPNSAREKDPLQQFNYAKIAVDALRDNHFYLHVDDAGKRFHSNLTNIRSQLRNCLTYDGQQLVSLDIRNSQPFMSIAVLTEEFWTKKVREWGFYTLFQSIFSKTSQFNSFITLLQTAQTQSERGFHEYIEYSSKGRLYDYIRTELSKQSVDVGTHKNLKATVFSVLFTDNRFIGQQEAAPKRLFKKIFPSIYEIFDAIKRKNSKLFPVLLQNIESYLVLKQATKKIGEEHPDIPLFTVHDSIVTTVENKAIVEDILIKTLTDGVGQVPTLASEYWRPDNIFFSDGVNYLSEINYQKAA